MLWGKLDQMIYSFGSKLNLGFVRTLREVIWTFLFYLISKAMLLLHYMQTHPTVVSTDRLEQLGMPMRPPYGWHSRAASACSICRRHHEAVTCHHLFCRKIWENSKPMFDICIIIIELIYSLGVVNVSLDNLRAGF